MADIIKAGDDKVIKQLMGYHLQDACCGTCLYLKEQEDPNVERSWISTCSLLEPTLGLLVVNPKAVCNRYVHLNPAG